MQKTNPEILQIPTPLTPTPTVDPRNDVKPFNDIRVREAMQMAIDLPTIAKSYYGNNADPWPDTLTSRYMTGWGWPYDQWPQDLKDEYAYNPTKAKQLLADAGYPNGFNTDIVVDSTADLDLLQVVKSYFSNVGINMDIRPMDRASWVAFVQTSLKQDQMSMNSAGSLGLSYEPIRQLERFQTGAITNIGVVKDPIFDAFEPKALAFTDLDSIKNVLRDANEYVARQHFAISLVQPNLFAFCQPWLKGYNGQNQSIPVSGSPQLLFFYPARFWIDQNLKKSMGH
jgi:peptide/nickel transport system substrate-binding protein